jgi:2-hydroxychromene-2-carboxylate isomerase
MKSLTFWFDVHSPWVYLASFRAGDIARKHGLALAWRPLHLSRLMDEIGGMKPLEASPQRVAWFRQATRWGEAAGLDPERVKAAAVSEDFKQRLEENTKAAIARGVFGVPTVDTGAKLYFGNDRLDLRDTHFTEGKHLPS